MKPARIIVLVIAVAAGGIAALLAGRPGPAPVKVAAPPPQLETVNVLVAASDIPMGRTLAAEDIRWQLWPRDAASPSFIRESAQPEALTSLTGAIVRSAFVTGEPIREDKVIKAGGSGFMAAILPSGKRALSIEISAESGAGGFILPRDRVDVILTRRQGNDSQVSEIILSDIQVLAIDQAPQEGDGQRTIVGRTATLEVSPVQAETLAVSSKLGSLSLALRSLADANRPPTEEELAQRRSRNETNIVRFGVSTTTSSR